MGESDSTRWPTGLSDWDTIGLGRLLGRHAT